MGSSLPWKNGSLYSLSADTSVHIAMILYQWVLHHLQRRILLVEHWSPVQVFQYCSGPHEVQKLRQILTGRARHGVAYCTVHSIPAWGQWGVGGLLPCVYWCVHRHGLQTGVWWAWGTSHLLDLLPLHLVMGYLKNEVPSVHWDALPALPPCIQSGKSSLGSEPIFRYGNVHNSHNSGLWGACLSWLKKAMVLSLLYQIHAFRNRPQI